MEMHRINIHNMLNIYMILHKLYEIIENISNYIQVIQRSNKVKLRKATAFTEYLKPIICKNNCFSIYTNETTSHFPL